MPIYAPVASAQQLAMEAAFNLSGKKPQEIDFIDIHAADTARGDPTEANWVGDMFKLDDELPIGLLKGNLGYVDYHRGLSIIADATLITWKSPLSSALWPRSVVPSARESSHSTST